MPKNKGCYFVFYDPKQNVFCNERFASQSELGEPFNLPVNCRNTIKIAEHCAGLIGIESSVRDGAPAGDEPEILQSGDFKEAFRVAAKKVNEWCQSGKGGLKSQSGGGLGTGVAKRCFARRNLDPCRCTTKFDDWRKDEGVLSFFGETFQGFGSRMRW